MSENTPTCQIHRKHPRIKCANAAPPRAIDGLCILHSQDNAKDPEAFKAALQARWNQADQEFYDFRGVFFPGPFDPDEVFGSREFNKPVDFTGSRFTEEANFFLVTFTEGANFSEATFSKEANFSEATFSKEATFLRAGFTEEADFSKAGFTKRADFSGVTFTEGANFYGATFTKRVKFYGATFAKRANFYGASFTKGAEFSQATFTEEVDFFEATFTELANFSGATFTKGANFSGVTFTELANFYRATFTEWADFTGATFTEGGNFSGASIGGRVVFREINPRDKAGRSPPFIGNFSGLEFQDRGVLRFQDVSLAHCTSTGTDLRRPEFQHVTWGAWRGRQIIYDEASLSQEEKENPWFWDWFWAWLSGHLALRTFALEIGHTADTTGSSSIGTYLAEEPAPPEPPWGDKYGEVERLYRNLQENYKQAGDYKNLGDFHYGEMEMHRRASKWGWFPFSWYYLYRLLSGYGERPCRALGLLILFLVAMTALLGWAGLEILDHKHSNGYGDPFFYLLQKVTLQRPTWAAPMGFGGKLVAGLSVLLIPGQAALFLLALRNRLGRRR